MTMSKQRLDAIMAQHLQAEVPWWPGQFVVSEITEDDWLMMATGATLFLVGLTRCVRRNTHAIII